jgi:preprotein translocase subunit SecB
MTQSASSEVGLVRMYLKDLSFESPSAPGVFRKNIQPDVKMRVAVKPTRIEENLFEVNLELGIDGRVGEEAVFIIEVEYAGLFEVKGTPESQLESVLTVFCPNILFPYVRPIVDQAMIQGGFPPLTLAPVNFEQLRRGH